MRTKCTFVWILAVFVFLFAQVDIAYALDNSTTLDNDHAAPIIGNGDSKTGGNNSLLETSGQKAYGVYISGDNSHWTFGDNSQTTTAGYDSIAAMINGSGSSIIFGDDTKIITTGAYAHGVSISGDKSSVEFNDGTQISTEGTWSHGVYLNGDGQTSVTFGNDTTIVNDSSSSIGVYIAGTNSSIAFGNDATITSNNRGTAVMINGYTYVGSNEIRFGDRAEISSEGLAVGINDGTLIIGDDLRITAGSGGLTVQALSDNHTEIKVGAGAEITTLDDWSYAISNSGTKGALITLGDGATIVANGAYSRAIQVEGQDGQVVFGKNANITTYDDYARAAWAGYSARIKFDDDAEITTFGDYSIIAYTAHDSAEITFGDNSIFTSNGTDSHIAYAVGDDSVIAFGSGNEMHTIGSYAYGVWSKGKETQITFGNNTIITTDGDSAYGAVSDGTDSLVEFGDGTSITTNGAGAHGAMITTSGSTGSSSINFGDQTSISTNNSGAYGAYVRKASSSMSFGDGTSITTTNNGAHGAAVTGTGSSMVFDGDVSIVTGGDNTSSAIVSGTSASIEFKGDTEITASGNGSYALYASEGEISSGQGGKYTISGDMGADVGTIDLDMTAGSLFTGAADADNGNITLNMTDSRWNVTEDSNLTLLNLDSTVVDYSNTALGTTITAGTLDGPGGTFLMKTDIVSMSADMLEITGTMNGSQHYITVRNDGSAASTGKEVVDLVDTADATGGFQLTNVVELGAWQYNLQQVSGGSYGNLWQLYSAGQMSSTADAAVNTVYAAYLLNYAETQTLIQRLGDLRQTPHLNGFWFRAHGGSFEFKATRATQPFDMDYWGVQLGYDRKLETSWSGDLYAGVMFGYSDGDIDYAYGGSGSVDSKTLGVYGTYVQPNGLFFDLVFKYQWTDSDFDIIDSAGTWVSGNGASSNGFGASLEFGKRISFAEKQQKSGWYVEPQVQMSLQRLGGGYFTTNSGMHVGTENYTSLLGRIGILAGYETEKSNFYAKVSKVKEFDGDVTILANSQPTDITLDSNWWVYGLGYTSRLDDRNSVYVDIERSSGGLFTQKWAFKAGWRMEF